MERECAWCSKWFIPKTKVHKSCSPLCYKNFSRGKGAASTVSQYRSISGDWRRYLSRLLSVKRRKELTLDDCLKLLEKQNYHCALSGIPLTCILERGRKTRTNASIDRKNPKGGYVISNIQFVCSALNALRSDMSVAEFFDWCRKVASYAVRE
jgi:hypothetical protein